MRHAFPARVILQGDEKLASRYVGEARVLLGTLLGELGETNILRGKRQRRYPGVSIDVEHDGTMSSIRIRTSPTENKAAIEVDLWVPRGFVIEPANNSAPTGWGLPAIPPPLDPLNPPPSPANWTIDGPIPQVLLSTVPDAGYPNRSKTVLPLYFDPAENRDQVQLPAESGAWAAYRPSFLSIGTAGAEVLAALNAERPADAELSLPFRGHANLAAWYQTLIATYGTADADFPIGSNTEAKRLAKDGTVYETAERTPTGVLEVADTSGAVTPEDVAAALIDAIPALGTDTLLEGSTTFGIRGGGSQTVVAAVDYRSQWVKAGNIDWISIHAEIPRISWTGPQGRCIPPHELAFGLRHYDYDPDHPGQAMFIDTMTTDFQGREFRLFDRFVYARGRVLAQLPDSGYCLGAAVQKHEATISEPLFYRLVVIAWHRADQFFQSGDTGYVKVWDTTSDVRVWYADIPARNGLAMLPQNVVEELYDEDTNPEGWQGGTRHRLWPYGTYEHGPGIWSPEDFDPGVYGSEAERCSPKTYWHPWFFNGSGTEATCMRASVYWNLLDPRNQGVFAPVQALKLAMDFDASSAVTSVWEMDERTAILFVPFGTEPAYYAWDYVGDTEVKAQLVYVDEPPLSFGSTQMLSTSGSIILSTVLPGASFEFFDMGTAWYFDARYNNYIVAVQEVEMTDGPLASFLVHDVNIRIGFNGADVATASGSVPGGVTIDNYSGMGMNGDASHWCNRDEWARTDAAHPRVMVSFASTENDFVAGVWYGYHPGDLTGDPEDYVTISVWGTVARQATSSFDAPALYSVGDGWLNNAGVL